MLIQVVGLPCSGKSTTLKSLKEKYLFLHLDKQKLSKPLTLSLLEDLRKESKQKTCIIESACGFPDIPSIVVLLKVNKSFRDKNVKQRAYLADQLDDNQIDYQTIPANFTVYSTKELYKILSIILQG